MENFKEILKELRKEKQLTQKQIAQKFCISPTCYAGWEQGYREPDLRELTELAFFFNVTTDYLLGLENEDGSKIKITNSFNNNKGQINFKG